MSDDSNTISSDGLRYKARVSGSPFGQTGNNSTMSCARCGVHKPRALGVYRKLAGKNMFVCGDCAAPNPTT